MRRNGLLRTAGDDGLIRLFSADGEAIQTPIRRSRVSRAVNALAFVDNGNKLISDCDDELCMWDLGDKAVPKPIGVYDDLSSVDPNTGVFFVGERPSDGGWSVKAVTSTGEVRVVSASPEGKLRALQYGQKSNLLAFVIDDKISVLDLASGAKVWSKDIPADGDVRLAFAKEDSWLGAVISQGPSRFVTSENMADRHADIRFLVFDASKGEKLAEKQHQSSTPIVDLVGVIKEFKSAFHHGGRKWCSGTVVSRTRDPKDGHVSSARTSQRRHAKVEAGLIARQRTSFSGGWIEHWDI